MRPDKRKNNQLRKIRVIKGFQRYAAGSVLIEAGNTRVVCSASVEDKVPPFLAGKGRGWLTAEYGMLPGSCQGRIPRESQKGKPSGRTQEIQRLIGRSLRAVFDLEALGERTITIDADVLQGDGGTRTAAITGGFIAAGLAVKKMMRSRLLDRSPVRAHVAAVSVGMLDGSPLLDLCYEEDSRAEVDMNVVMTSRGEFVEVQGTAEGRTFSRKHMDSMLRYAAAGIRDLITLQKKWVDFEKKGRS